MMSKEYARQRLTELNNRLQRVNGELTLDSWKLWVIAGAYELALAVDSDRDSLERILLSRVNGTLTAVRIGRGNQ